jgi:hypothetical protein
MFRVNHESFQRNVSNPAQNFFVSTCHDIPFRDAKCLELLYVSGCLLVARKTEGRFDGTHASPLAQSDPLTANLHCGLVRKAAGLLTPRAPEVRSQRMCPFCGLINATPPHVLPGVRQVSQSDLGCQSARPCGLVGQVRTEVSIVDGLGCAVVFGKREVAPMRKQYLHLSAYSCDRCSGPVVAGSLAVRENEISKETDIKQVGAICLSCGHRQSKMTKLGMPRQFPPVEWEQQITADASHFSRVLEEVLNRAT